MFVRAVLGMLISPLWAEMYQLSKVKEVLQLKEPIAPNSISMGYFKAEEGSNMTFRVEIRSKDLKRVLYRIDKLEVAKESHFSFSSNNAEDAVITITALALDPSEVIKPGIVALKFENAPDTFNKDVSRKTQIEPAMYGLEQLLKKMNDLIALSRSISGKIGSLGSENRSMLHLVVFLSFITFGGYLLFNILQLYFMKSYLNAKKFL
ncbi:hypothetical protein PAPHI01_1891 [Pancytospora philotis]|nr:hypothetical protein PAPHI01_1891 [Pancytospora philotis]